MSYAEQFFGTKQNQVLQYAENLAFFGEESYVYKNASLMKEVIANEVALLNPTTAYYCYLWARENGYAAIDYFNVGLVIAIYQSELDATYHFVLVDFNDDGSGIFISREPCIMCQYTCVSNGLDILNYEDYEIVQYLNGETNWYSKWENKPASQNNNPSNNILLKKLRVKNGFLNGFDYRFKKLLKTFKEGYNFPILPITYTDYNNSVMNTLNYKNNFKKITENCYNFYYDNITDKSQMPSNIKTGGSYYGCLIEEVTAEQIATRPTFRGGWDQGGQAYSVASVQTQTGNNTAVITGSSPTTLKIQF